ncbi:DEAD domain-containing protein/Helicase_C domain-containing protein [Cephalotus follicularis]|uniref:ATP-dependent RNA helicase n=1 Tax=Cephalotus follicularis TaxID=3775 RepID=A0A1Q3BSF0_CEPFO|nr:DEAD domain-containing protein/Helicase_C domain-containing protein [Cephalotus follicularis]
MPIKLIPPLRLLNTALPVARFPSMNCGASIHSSRSLPIFSRVFHFKLKYLALTASSSRFNASQLAVRRLSTRSPRPRAGSSPEFSRRGDGRASSKSLIDDEAELSDWIGELRSVDSFRGRREGESDSDGPPNNRVGVRDRDRGRFGRDRDRGESFSMKRRRESGSGEFGESNDPRRTRNESDSFSRTDSRFGNKRFSEEKRFGSTRKNSGFQGEKQFDSPRKTGGFRGEKHDDVDFSDDNDEEEEKGLVSGGFGDFLREEDGESDDLDDDDDDSVLRKKANSSLGFEKEASVITSVGKDDSYLSESRFDQCTVSPLSLKAIKDAGYEKMTVVQEATLPVILKGKDVLAKAKTGTGKTVAFLLPSIEVVVKSPPVARDEKRPPILVLVICPTRELASQAAAEANTLLKYHSSIGVQVVIGGTRLALEQKRMQANPCQILVATPGRLRDHIENTAGFATRLMGVKVLVLDEADHLLDMGFRKDIEKIIAAVPKQRQTLLFSATVPEEVRQICHIALKRDHEFINTVHEGSGETHSQVIQMHLVAPLDKQFSLLYILLKEHIADDVDYKVLVFCTTAMVTRLVANLLGELKLNVREIHSRKPQSYRTRISDEFRKSKGLILVTSDVSARGVDYPDVTLVIQMGLPSDREQYIHRLGRTGRKGKEGQGILLLAPWEEFFLSSIKDLPITKAPVPSVDPDTKKNVERALSHVEMKNKEAAYQAWLGFYNSNKGVGRDKYRLVELANEFSRSMGLDNPPAIPKLVLGKMGLKNVPGLRSK